MAAQTSRLLMLGYYLQMFAAFLLLALTHYFTAAFLPIADCDETFNFVEPAHYLLYGTGKQTWENCPQYALRSWLFAWVYAWPATFIKGASSLASVDVYYYLRIFNGRLVALAQLYLVYSVWAASSGKAAMVLLTVLLLNYPIPHAAVSVLPTSFVMACYFIALGSWLRTMIPCRKPTATPTSKVAPAVDPSEASLFYAATVSRGSQVTAIVSTVFFVVLAGVLGWPFAGLVAVPIGLDLLIRFPLESILCLILSLAIIAGASLVVDSFYFCKPVLVAWNIVKYNVFGGEGRGPELYGTEPWFYFFKNLLLNFHLVFIAALVAPVVVLLRKSRPTTAAMWAVAPTRRRGRQLVLISPFFLWFIFWLGIAHKEERFMSPAYPFMVLAATLTITHIFFPDRPAGGASAAAGGAGGLTHSRRQSPHARQTSTTLAPGARTGDAASTAQPANRRAPRQGGRRASHRGLRFLCGAVFLLVFGTLSFSRAMAVYHFYSAPERALYDWYLAVQQEAIAKVARTGTRYQICVGKEWYRFPSSFFLDSRYADYQFIKTKSFSGLLPVTFPSTALPAGQEASWVIGMLRGNGTAWAHTTGAATDLGTCRCGADAMNDLNRAIPEQYVDVAECDAVFDSILTPEEAAEVHLDQFPRSFFASDAMRRIAVNGAAQDGPHSGQFYHPRAGESYRLLDVDHTPMWCRVLYYPFGISDRCARWRKLAFQARRLYNEPAQP